VLFGIVRPEIFDLEPDLSLKLGQTEPKISGTVPTNRHTTIPNDSGPNSASFNDDPKLLHCEKAEPKKDSHTRCTRALGIPRSWAQAGPGCTQVPNTPSSRAYPGCKCRRDPCTGYFRLLNILSGPEIVGSKQAPPSKETPRKR
jgi:hypothetical protein